jgi:hypothetical protein
MPFNIRVFSLDDAKHKLKKAGPQGLPFFVGSGHPESYPRGLAAGITKRGQG